MQIDFIENLPSTHKSLCEWVKSNKVAPPYLLYVDEQTRGIGSRNNTWLGEKGNLYMSFCVHKNSLPNDLPAVSVCIYFAYLMKEVLEDLGSLTWLKWPNDFFLDEKKIGGAMSAKIGDVYVVSFGINLLFSPDKFGVLDVKIGNEALVKKFVEKLKKNLSWKKVFSKFRVEFQKNKDFTFHHNGQVRCLGEAVLCEDGSLKIDKEKVYNLR